MKTQRRRSAGFTVIEVLLVMLTIATLLKVILPNMREMQSEGSLTKVDEELVTLKTAIISYWRAHNNLYPDNITTDLVNTTPQLLASPMADPFRTEGTTYGYEKGVDASFGPWFAVFSKGPRGDTLSVVFEAGNRRIRYGGSGRVVSNAPVVKY